MQCTWLGRSHFPGTVALWIIQGISDFPLGKVSIQGDCLVLDNGPIGPILLVWIGQTLWVLECTVCYWVVPICRIEMYGTWLYFPWKMLVVILSWHLFFKDTPAYANTCIVGNKRIVGTLWLKTINGFLTAPQTCAASIPIVAVTQLINSSFRSRDNWIPVPFICHPIPEFDSQFSLLNTKGATRI